MRKICISLSKGGVGKSTSAVSIAHALAMSGRRVLLVDTDDQGQDGFLLGVETTRGLPEVIADGENPVEVATKARPNLFLLSGGKRLSAVKRDIGRKDFGAERTLSDALKPVEKCFDYILLDTAPTWDALTINALFFCNEVVMPVSPEVLSVHGLTEFSKRLDEVEQFNRGLIGRYLLPTFFDRRVKKTGEIMSLLQEHYGPIMLPAVRYCSRVSEATGFGKTIFEHAPNSTASQDYKLITERIIAHGQREDPVKSNRTLTGRR